MGKPNFDDIKGCMAAMLELANVTMVKVAGGEHPEVLHKLTDALLQVEKLRWALGHYPEDDRLHEAAELAYGFALRRVDEAQHAWVVEMDAALQRMLDAKRQQAPR